MSISSSAVLVRLSISTWTGRKIDKHQSENVSAATGADKKAGKYIKDTMVGSTHVSQLCQQSERPMRYVAAPQHY
jgi:hypothetical protein